MPVILTDEEKERKFQFVGMTKDRHSGELFIGDKTSYIIGTERYRSNPQRIFSLEEIQNMGFSDSRINKTRRCKPGCAVIISTYRHQHGVIYAMSTERHWNPEIGILQSQIAQLITKNSELTERIKSIVGELQKEQGLVQRTLKKVRTNLDKKRQDPVNKFADVRDY
jgi:hypothetical protein